MTTSHLSLLPLSLLASFAIACDANLTVPEDVGADAGSAEDPTPDPGDPNPDDPNPGDPNPDDPNPGDPNPGDPPVDCVEQPSTVNGIVTTTAGFPICKVTAVGDTLHFTTEDPDRNQCDEDAGAITVLGANFSGNASAYLGICGAEIVAGPDGQQFVQFLRRDQGTGNQNDVCTESAGLIRVNGVFMEGVIEPVFFSDFCGAETIDNTIRINRLNGQNQCGVLGATLSFTQRVCTSP